MQTIRIRYCGGCNPAYDRVKFASDFLSRLHQKKKDEFKVVSGKDSPADIELVICGCSVCCLDNDAEQQGERPSVKNRYVVGPELLNYYKVPQEELLSVLVAKITGEEE